MLVIVWQNQTIRMVDMDSVGNQEKIRKWNINLRQKLSQERIVMTDMLMIHGQINEVINMIMLGPLLQGLKGTILEEINHVQTVAHIVQTDCTAMGCTMVLVVAEDTEVEDLSFEPSRSS